MTSRPAAPESETPRCDALHSNPLDSNDLRAWRNLARDLEHQIFLAQTEIKGHMRVEDEQRCDLSLSASTITELNRKFAEARERIAELHRDNATLYRKYDQAQDRIAELEKDWETDADYIRMAERIKELENDAAALRDALRPFVRVWPNTVSTISLHIAEEMLAKGYAYDVTRDAALKSRA